MASAMARHTGLDLRLRRTVAGISQTALAAAMGVSRQRVGHLESALRPPVPAIERYLAALDRAASILDGPR